MSAIARELDFSTPQEVYDPGDGPAFDWPFEVNGDFTSFTVTRRYKQTIEKFIQDKQANLHPLALTTDRTYPAYLVEIKPAGRTLTGLQVFTRTFASVPTQQTVSSNFSFTRPNPAAYGTAVSSAIRSGSGTVTNLGQTGSVNYLYGGSLFINSIPASAYSTIYHAVYGPAFTVVTSAANSGNCRVTWTGHGLAGTEKICVWLNGGSLAYYTLFASGEYSVIDADTIDLTGFSAVGTGATLAAKYLRSYTPGLAMARCKVVSDFYLPGVTAGITTSADISIPADLLNDPSFLDAVIANPTGYVNYQTKTFAQWKGWPIWQREVVQLNFADL